MSSSWCAETSMSLRKMWIFTIPNSGGARSCARTASERPFKNSAMSACATRSGCIRNRREFSPGGIIECWHFQKTAGCESMPFWRAIRSPKNARRQESIVNCEKAKILPITRQFGQTSTSKSQTQVSSNYPNSNGTLPDLEDWCLESPWCLGFGAWDL